MNAMHLIVFAHKIVKEVYIIDKESNEIATGLGNYLGNKGGIGVKIIIGNKSLLFVNCHLAAKNGEANCSRRINDFARIEGNL